MPDSPLAVRVPDETKELFNELAEKSGFEKNGDFLNRLLALYQAEQMKDNVSTLKPAIEAVETLLGRLIEILAGVGASITTNDEKHKQELDDKNKSFEETRTLLQQRISTKENELSESEERAASLLSEIESTNSKVSELQQQIRQLESTISDKTALVDEYKSKNDTLNSIIAEYKGAAAENKNLNNTINDLKQVNVGLQQQIGDFKKEQQRQIDSFTVEQDNLRKSLLLENDKALLEKDTAMLELKQASQARAEEQQAKHAAAISEYENKVKELLNLLQSERDKTVTQSNEKPAVQSTRKTKKAATETPPDESDKN